MSQNRELSETMRPILLDRYQNVKKYIKNETGFRFLFVF
jgi:hypothetical protein